MQYLLLAFAIAVFSGTLLRAEDPAPLPPTKATFLITGLHCPPCSQTVEGALRRVPGVRAVQVDWRTKRAKVEFDEGQLSAQTLAARIAATPHMMGGNMHYKGWLSLRVQGLMEEKTRETAKAALMKIAGVAQVAVYPEQGAMAIRFDGAQKVTTQQILQSLKDAGCSAEIL